MRRLERSTIEAFFCLIVGIIGAATPMSWILTAFLFLIATALASDMAIHAPWRSRLKSWQRITIEISAVLLIVLLGTYSTWIRFKEDQNASAAEQIAEITKPSVQVLTPEQDKEAMANAETVAARREIITPYLEDWGRNHPGDPVRSTASFLYINHELRITGKNWRITKDNVNALLGGGFTNVTIGGGDVGIQIDGTSSGSFDHTRIYDEKKGVIVTDHSHITSKDLTINGTPIPDIKPK